MNLGTQRLLNHIGMKHNAKLLLTNTLLSGDQLSMYTANGCTFIVQIFADGGGFEVYLPASRSLSIDTTIEALDKYIEGTI